MTRSLLLIELNEFDPEFLGRAAQELGLAHIHRALGFAHSRTHTEEAVETQGLDPWSQWVGVHGGLPTSAHGIRRLGDTRRQTRPQLWHAVAARGYSWGAWGVMNAPAGDLTGGKFFMPDPWSFEEQAFPDYLNDLLTLPRYGARNYFGMDRMKAFAALLRLVRFFAPPRHWGILARFSVQTTRASMGAGVSTHTFTTLLDYLSVLMFLRLRRKDSPAFSIIFLNHIAHLQHHFWLAGDGLHPQMKLGLELCDAMLGLLLADRGEGEAVVIANAFRQRNVAGMGYYCWRQRNPEEAAAMLGMPGRVEQNMTGDGTVLCDTPAEADRAFAVLDSCALSDGQKVFFVERQEARRVFYQVDFKRAVAEGTLLLCGEKRLPFHDLFQLICERTGEHVQQGDVFADGIRVPERLQNHELYHVILSHFSHA